ncbi:exocyst complex component 3 isoform X3 [Mustela putorius furo]|uniref:Exocyst complex component 3 isoform X3 n=1 Tax=Mustela putorius furo TaxID=9669 RepID=A0A8U0SM61_MUSPF|nr:exocyst complex component 3 isoform X3 [Mustela putorius furo]
MRRGGESKEGTHSAASVRTGQGLVEALGLVGVAWGQEVWGGPFRAMSLYLASERLCSLSGNSVICHMGGAPCLLSTVPSPYHPILIPSPLSGSPASPQETLRRSDPFPSFIPSLVSVNFFCSSLNFGRPRSVICRSSSHHVQPHHGPAPAASYLVPEIVRETQDLIEQGALLQAHRKLMDLECSRDGLMYEQYRMDSGNTRDMTLIHSYFGSTQGLSDELAKQLWMVLQRSLVTVRRDPTLLVSVVRIIEREEKIDRRILDRKKQTSFVPPGRPKNWKEKMFAILDRTVTTRIEGTQADTRESDKMWLVRHLEIIRKYVLDDLIVAKNLMVQCFPPHYEIFRNLLSMYHQALSTRMQELAAEDLEANEIVSLLTWVLNTYTSAEMMGNAELAPEVDVSTLEPLLSADVVSELLNTYMSTLTSNIIAWLRKALETDKKDWVKETEPEADQDGYYQTTLPAIVFQMFEQNLQVAAQISEDLKTKVLVLCLQQMNSFLSRYKEEAQSYKEEHLRDRQHPHCYVQYMIAVINNCQTFKESIVSLKRKYLKSETEEGVSLTQPSMDGILDTIAQEGCSSLLEEVFLDLEQHLSELMTRKWLLGSNAVDIICVTVEDYFSDFAKIKKPYKKGFGEDADGHCDTIVAIAEVIKLTDPSLLYLEVSTLVSKYPDIRDEHIGALLAMRGDTSRDLKQTIIETLEQGPTQANPNYVPIFKEIMVPSLNVAKLLK